MSQSNRNSPYWAWLESSASPQEKRDLQKAEQSKQSSFVSSREVIARRYGQLKTS